MPETTYIVIVEGYIHVLNARDTIAAIDMSDCAHVEAVYRVRLEQDQPNACGDLERLTVRGPWHSDEPLYIAVEDTAGNMVFDGYGTDH